MESTGAEEETPWYIVGMNAFILPAPRCSLGRVCL